MRNFVIALIAIVLHRVITELASISYNFLTSPMDVPRLLMDLLVFAAVYFAVALLLRKS